MARMTFDQICDALIEYFADHFNDPPANFTKGTNVKVTYNCSGAVWGAFADKINALPWMTDIGVRIAQREMGPLPTIGQLGKFIFDRQGAAAKKVPFTGGAGAGLAARKMSKTRKAAKRAVKSSKAGSATRSSRKSPKKRKI